MPTPSDLLAAMMRSDPGRPRVTFYDDTPGPTQHERVELSAKVLANWVSKAGNCLQEEWDLGPGARVLLALPAHWRATYWAMATWSVGAAVAFDGDADLVVTDDPSRLDGGVPGVLVSLPALARSASVDVPASALDEARDLAQFGDELVAGDSPEPQSVAWVRDGVELTYADVVPASGWPALTRVHVATDDLGDLLVGALSAWAVDGSVVLSRGPAPVEGRGRRCETEGVTLSL